MEIKGNLYFDIIIGDSKTKKTYKNFLRYSDLLVFKMVEYTGSSGIIIECSIRVYDKKIKDAFLQNNPVSIKLGESEEKSDTIKIEFTEIIPTPDAQNKMDTISFAGVLSHPFIHDTESKSYKGNSLEVLQQLSDEYFNGMVVWNNLDEPIEQMSKGSTSMNWLRNYKTGLDFMLDVWLHSDFGSSKCPIININKEGYLIIKDINEAVKTEEPACRFTHSPKSGSTIKEYRYLNKFNVTSYKYQSNLFLGYGTILNIKNIETGKDTDDLLKSKVDLASSKQVETAKNTKFKFITNKYNSSNVHKTYQNCYYRNVLRLTQLSSIVGYVDVLGYIKDVNVGDIVELECGDEVDNGRYIVNTKTTTFGSTSGIMTTFYICRDNKNHIENNILGYEQKVYDLMDSMQKTMARAVGTIRNLKRLVVMTKSTVSGEFSSITWAYLNNFKYNLLSSFSLFGATLDLNNSMSILNSLKSAGNNLCNQIIDRFIPYPLNYVFRNIALEQPSWKTLLSRLLNEFCLYEELKGLIVEIVDLFQDITGQASDMYNEIESYQQENIQSYIATQSQGESMTLQDNQKRVENITDEFISNTEGVDIPIPQVDLTESESLLPDTELKDLLADKTIVWLIEQGYLNGVDDFKPILLGEKSLDFNTIQTINNNIGNMLYARYWGTFKDVSEITEFFVKNSYKDIYVTVPTTKIVNALKGARVFMALPITEQDITFYLNNKEVTMEVIENMNIGLYTQGGSPLYYNVYISTESFNSNSVIFEVRKK